MSRHEEKAMSCSMALEAFKKLIDLERELMALLQKRGKATENDAH